MADNEPLKVLFVCSRNQWRSPTAERLWKNQPGVIVRSAGVSKSSRRRLTLSDLVWADLVLVMEDEHKSRIRSDYRDVARDVELHVLDVPDEYQFMQPELVEQLKAKVAPLLERAQRS